MTRFIKSLGAAPAGVLLATSAFAQSAREVRGPSPFVALENEPAPRLVVDPPLPDQLAEGVVQIQYRVENEHMVSDGIGIDRDSPDGYDLYNVLWWSHREKWEPIGDFGGVCLPLDDALEYIAEDPMGCFWH